MAEAAAVTTDSPSAAPVVMANGGGAADKASTGDLIATYAAEMEKGPQAEPESNEAAKADKPTKADKAPKGEKLAKAETKAEAKPEEPKTDEPVDYREKAAYHLKHGDVAKALDAAFGDLKSINESLPDGVREALARKLGVSSQQWEKVRRYEKQVKQEAAAKDAKVNEISDQLLKRYEPFEAARQAFQAGQIDKAHQLVFGMSVDDLVRASVNERLDKNPEVERLKVQLEEERRERRAWEQQQQKQAEEARLNAQHKTNLINLESHLRESDDAQIASWAQKPNFVKQVYSEILRHYDEETGASIPPHQAAEAVRDRILQELGEWEYPGDSPAKALQASELPEQPSRAKARVRNLKQNSAAEATATPKKLTTKELQQKYAALMDAASD